MNHKGLSENGVSLAEVCSIITDDCRNFRVQPWKWVSVAYHSVHLIRLSFGSSDGFTVLINLRN